MVVSEEWLATGKHAAYRAFLETFPGSDWMKNWERFDKQISLRQCVDLWSDPVARHIPPGTLFSVAYSTTLAPRYAALVKGNPYQPLLTLTNADSSDTAINYLRAINERHVAIMVHEAESQNVEPSGLWQNYTSMVAQTADMAFQNITFGVENIVDVDEAVESVLPKLYARINTLLVPPTLQKLLERLNTATKSHGKKSELATFLGVALPTVSVWLSGKQEPSGGTTLRLLEWVQAEEAKQQKGPAGATTPTEPRTRTRKPSDETKSQSSPPER